MDYPNTLQPALKHIKVPFECADRQLNHLFGHRDKNKTFAAYYNVSMGQVLASHIADWQHTLQILKSVIQVELQNRTTGMCIKVFDLRYLLKSQLPLVLPSAKTEIYVVP